MKRMIGRASELIANMILSSIAVTPILLSIRFFLFESLDWTLVFMPLLCTFHLLLCWVAGGILARVLLDLFRRHGGT